MPGTPRPPSHTALAALPAVASGFVSTGAERDETIVERHPFD